MKDSGQPTTYFPVVFTQKAIRCLLCAPSSSASLPYSQLLLLRQQLASLYRDRFSLLPVVLLWHPRPVLASYPALTTISASGPPTIVKMDISPLPCIYSPILTHNSPT